MIHKFAHTKIVNLLHSAIKNSMLTSIPSLWTLLVERIQRRMNANFVDALTPYSRIIQRLKFILYQEIAIAYDFLYKMYAKYIFEYVIWFKDGTNYFSV